MSKQLRAALVRALWPAIGAAAAAYFGVNLATGEAAGGAADAAIEDTGTAAEDAVAAEEVADDARSEGQKEADDREVLAAVITGAAVLLVRGLLEGKYDERRAERGDVNPADVGVTSKPLGAWIKVKNRADRFYVLGVRRTSNDGGTQYLAVTEQEPPMWVDDDDVDGWALWDSKAEEIG